MKHLALALLFVMGACCAQDVAIVADAADYPAIPDGKQAIVVLVDEAGTRTNETPRGPNRGGAAVASIDADKAQRKALILKASQTLGRAYQAEDLSDEQIEALKAQRKAEFDARLKQEVEAIKAARIRKGK